MVRRQSSASFGRWPALSHGRSNVSSAQFADCHVLPKLVAFTFNPAQARWA